MTELFKPTLDEQIYEVERELKVRASVYANWLAVKKISPAKARQQIDRMEAVLETLRGLKMGGKHDTSSRDPLDPQDDARRVRGA